MGICAANPTPRWSASPPIARVSGPVGIYRDKNYSFHQWSICLQTKQVVGIRLTEYVFLCFIFFHIKK